MGIHLTWEYGRKLTAISGAGLEVSYTYSADGKRLSKTVNGVTTEFTTSAIPAAGASAGSTLTKNEHEGRCASKTVSSPARPPVVRRTGYYYNSYRYRRGAQQ